MILIGRGLWWVVRQWFWAFGLSLRIFFYVASFGVGWFIGDAIGDLILGK